MMVHGAVVLAAMLAAAVGDSKGKSPHGQPRARQIVLDEQKGKVFEIRAARNVVTTVEFPEEMVERPICPDCADASDRDAGDALFRLEASKAGRYLAIWPSNAASRRWASLGEGVLTSVVVRLEHAALTLVVHRVEQPKADTRVVFVAPNRAMESEYLRVEKSKLEAVTTAKIEEGVTQRFLQAFGDPHRCEQKRGRARNDDVVLEVREICNFGRDVIIVFTVENRARAPLDVGSVVVNGGAKKKEYLSSWSVDFQQTSTGVVALKVPEGADARGPYEISVEGSGKRRGVTLSKIEL